jgi:pSer/pThr/pTyr-binding forkhead associated (FHA) protein
LQRSNDDLRHKVERLHAVSNDDTRLLNERNTELARSRGEVQELNAALQGIEASLRARDTLIENLRAEIRTAQDERGIMSEQLTKARGRVKTMTQQLYNRDNRIATLKADLAVHIEALAAIRQDVDRMSPEAEAAAAPLPVERFLEPVNHEGEPILLNRRVMTIGRTNDNDIFIPSKMISRHHARLLVGPNAVIVEDVGSTNGCYVNDQLVKQHVLHEGDVLAIGDLKFRLGERAASGPATGEVIAFGDGRRHDD